MAKKNRNEVAVGITMLVVLSLTIYIVVMLADWSSMFTKYQEITVRLPHKVGLKGLSQGSPVHIGGVKVGQITETWIKKLEKPISGCDVYVYFTMKIPVQYQLRRDCVLLAQSNVLGGESLLSIEDLGCKGDVIANGQTVDLRLSQTVLEAMKNEFDPNNPQSFFAMLKYEVNRENEDSVMASLKNIAATLEKDIPALTSHFQKTLAKVDEALETANSSLKDIKGIVSDERIDRIINNIDRISVNLKLTTQEVRRAPWKLLYKPNEKEFRVQSLVDSAGAFAAGAESLDSTSLRLKKLLAEPDDAMGKDKDKIKTMVSELDASFQQFQKAEQKFWDDLK